MKRFFLTRFFSAVPRQLWFIIFGTALILFFRLSHVDMMSDDAHYSARALGLADFMFGDDSFQSTPLHWFPVTPSWAHWSFHDHPLLLFFIQHVFLAIRESIFFAKLPYTLMALCSLLAIFFVMEKLSDRRTALTSSLLLALNAHFLWTGRVAFMEAGVIFFILLSLYFFIRFFEDDRFFVYAGIALGLAFSAKFTAFFLLPAYLLTLLLVKRERFRSLRFWGFLATAFLIFLPTILYNFFMYQTRGHLSLQFARLFGQGGPWDFSGVITEPYGRGLITLFQNLGWLASWPSLAVFCVALLYLLWQRKQVLLLFAILFFTIQQLLIGQSGHVLAPYSVFMAMTVAFAWQEGRPLLRQKIPAIRSVEKPFAIMFLAYLLVFAGNSHLLGYHAGPIGWLRSQLTSSNYGMHQLDTYLNDLLAQDRRIGHTFDIYYRIKIHDPALNRFIAHEPKDVMKAEREHATVILFDSNISWFARVWLFERRRFYHNTAAISAAEHHLLKDITIQNFYLIKATEHAALDIAPALTDYAAQLEEYLLAKGIEPQTLIYRDDGKVAYKVYYADNIDLK